ncbi:MAG: hypothetical protein ACLUHE_10580 [Christensenellales bacterium]
MWDTALLAQGIARRKAGEEWYEITGTAQAMDEGLKKTEREDPLKPEGLDGARLTDKSEPDTMKARGCGSGKIRPDGRKPCAV